MDLHEEHKKLKKMHLVMESMGEDAYGDESNAIGYHIRNLWDKLCEAEPGAPFYNPVCEGSQLLL